MATEALRRLREEIDAAFEAQRGTKHDNKQVQISSESLAPKWAQVTALLASVGRPATKRNSPGTEKLISQSFLPDRCSTRGGNSQKMTDSERRRLVHQVLVEWRRLSHAAALVTRLHVRARRRGEKRLAAAVLSAWRCRVVYCIRLYTTASLVKKQEESSMLTVVWTRWTCVQHRAATVKEFCLRRRKRVSCEAFCAWVLAVSQRAMYRQYKRKAAKQLLRRYWRWLMAGIEAQRVVNVEVERFCQQRVANLQERCFLRWGEYAEQRKQWQFAVRWSERRLLGDAYDFWRDSHEHTRSMRRALQLSTRRRRRRLLREVLRAWGSYAQRAQARKQAIAIVLHKQQRRRAFMRLMLNAQRDRERQCSLQDWKTRRAVWTWHSRSHQYRMLRLRAAFLKENHDRLVLRRASWGPWRRTYQLTLALRQFTLRRRATQLRRIWVAFVAAVHQQERSRLVVESIIDRRKVRHLREAIVVWRLHANSIRERKKLIAWSTALCRRRLLRQNLSSWKEAHHVVRREKSLNTIAIQHLVRKMLQHWTSWAYWSRRELTGKITAVVERRRLRRARQCIDHWRLVVRAKHKALYGKFFNSWTEAIELQHRERHLQELRRLVQLRWRWRRWYSHVFQCQEMRCIASDVQKLRELRLLRHALMAVWLRKARRYSMGSSLLKKVGERHVLCGVLARWRENQLRLSAVRRADTFHSRKLQCRYLSRMYALTVGRSRAATSCARRRHLARGWDCWRQYFVVRQRRREADAHFRRRSKQKAVHLLQVAAASAITRRDQELEAEVWHEAVLLQSAFGKWRAAAKYTVRCRLLEQQLTWNAVGRRAFHLWQGALMEKQQSLKGARFHSLMLLTRSWNALLRVTKRRQVAVVMWSHAMKRIRLANVFLMWKEFRDARQGQYAVAAAMYRMQQQRTRQRLFAAWSLLVVAGRLASRLEQQESLRWRHVCWTHWRLWRVSIRWQRSGQRSLLQNTFCRGLRRYALQQQACREVCGRAVRNVLRRSLARWRVELWLVRNQTKVISEAKRKALTQWKVYIAACRQKRRWEHYIQQLHRSQTGSRAVSVQDKRRKAGIFHNTRALQAQLKRSRVLMTHVLHAWFLVAQSRRRRLQSGSRAMSISKKSRRRQVTERPHASSKGKQEALEFWARRVMQRCFFTWRERVGGKRAELA